MAEDIGKNTQRLKEWRDTFAGYKVIERLCQLEDSPAINGEHGELLRDICVSLQVLNAQLPLFEERDPHKRTPQAPFTDFMEEQAKQPSVEAPDEEDDKDDVETGTQVTLSLSEHIKRHPMGDALLYWISTTKLTRLSIDGTFPEDGKAPTFRTIGGLPGVLFHPNEVLR